MLAEYVQVSPEELAELVDDPSPAAALFHDAGSVAVLLESEAVRERIERLSPQVLEGTLREMDPRLQEEIAKRLRVAREALGSEDAGKAMLRLMQSRVLGGNAERQPRRKLSLDKAWHGLHYLLCGQAEPALGPLGSVVLGGTEIGDDEGYGPARYFDADAVLDIAAALDRDGLDGELESRYDAERMSELGLYPGGWHESGPDWLLDSFRELRDFFREAAANRRAVVTCLV